jgi:hypothetical protein
MLIDLRKYLNSFERAIKRLMNSLSYDVFFNIFYSINFMNK